MDQHSLTEQLEEILAIFDGEAEPLTTPEVADRFDLGRRTAYNRLERLVEYDRLKTKKVGASARIWWRPQSPPEGGDDEDSRVGQSEQVTRVEQQFRSLVEVTDEYAIFLLDPDGHVQTWNPGAARIKGYDAEEILDEHFSIFYTEEDRASGIPERNLRAAANHVSIQEEGWRLRNDGSRFWANVTITAIRGEEGDLIGYAKVTRDMTDRKRREAEREFQYETTRDIAQAETFTDGLRAALQDVYELTDWEYAEAWIPTDDGELRRADIDYYEGDFAEFAEFSEGYTFGRDEGLPGRVWATGEFEWAGDLSNGSIEAYPRRERAIDVNLKSSLGVPVVADGDVVAVLTFFMSEARDTDERLVDVLSSVAADLGELLVRRRVEEEMIHERDLIDQILAVSPIGIQVLNRDGEITRMNNRAREILEIPDDRAESYSPAERTVYSADEERVSPGDRPFSRVLATGEAVFDWQARVELPDNGHRWVTINAVPVLDAEGEIERVVTTGMDITQLKDQTRRLERQREELKHELDEMFERISDGFYALDNEFRITYVNDHAEELLGLEESSVIGQDLKETVALTDKFEAALHRALEEQTSVRVEDYYEPLDAWFESTIYPSESGVSVYFRSITERKERERALERYESVAETASDVILSINDQSRIEGANAAVKEMFGYTPDELLGESLTLLIPDRLTDAQDVGIAQYLQTGERTLNWDHIELPGVTADGAEVPLSISFSEYEYDDQHYFTGIIRDISERKNRERVLREMHEIISDRAQSFEKQVQALLRLGRSEFDMRYGTLSQIQGDDYAFEFVDSDDDGIQAGDRTSVSATNCDIVASKEQTVVLGDIERDAPEETDRAGFTDWGISCYLGAPVFVDDDVYGTVCFYDTDARSGQFSVWEETVIDLMSGWLSYELQRRKTNERLHEQNEQLAALNSLNEVIQEITNAVIEQSTREEIEKTVCERLAGAESYLFAWIGDVDPHSQTVNMRTESGVEGYLDDNTISVDPGDDRSDGPTGRALRTGEIQVTGDVEDDPRYGPWRHSAEEHGFRSSAAVPIVHDDSVYGVLNIYAERPNAFTGQERTMLTQLGEVVGHAIAALERKQTLLSDELVELEFRIKDIFAALGAPIEIEETITIEDTVAIGDGQFLVYGTAAPDAVESLRGLVETIPQWESVTVRSEGDPAHFELRLRDSSMLSVVASRGGYVNNAVIEDGDFRMTIHLSPTVEARRVVDGIKEAYPGAEMVRRRQFTRVQDELHPFNRQLVTDLTDRQRSALEAAYYSGYFEWPRDRSGEEVAGSLGVAPPTFHLHLRKAEQKVFERLFSASV